MRILKIYAEGIVADYSGAATETVHRSESDRCFRDRERSRPHANYSVPRLRQHHQAVPDNPETWITSGTAHFRMPPGKEVEAKELRNWHKVLFFIS